MFLDTYIYEPIFVAYRTKAMSANIRALIDLSTIKLLLFVADRSISANF